MVLGPFDVALLTRGFSYYPNPSAGALLDLLGLDEEQRVVSMAAMLRNSDEDEIAEMANLFAMAMAILDEERALERPRPRERDQDRDDDRTRRRRRASSAEWRAERRRASWA